MSYPSADKKIHQANHSRVQDMNKLRATAVLPGVTGLTGLNQKTAADRRNKKEAIYKSSFSVHMIKRYLMGSCTISSKKF